MKGKGLIQSITKFTKKRTPEILTGFGIAGMITTTVLAVKATPKAISLIDDARHMDENGMPIAEEQEISKLDIVKVAWKPYIPAAVTCALSIGCLVGASSVNCKRNAALATAYELSRSAMAEYREKVVETIGENKEKKVREKVNQDKINNDPVSDQDIILTDKGSTLCYEPITGRYFRSDTIFIKKCINELNRIAFTDVYVSLNTFYSMIGLKEADIGECMGWNINCDDGSIDIDFTAQMTDKDEPCAVIDYITSPIVDYNQCW